MNSIEYKQCMRAIKKLNVEEACKILLDEAMERYNKCAKYKEVWGYLKEDLNRDKEPIGTNTQYGIVKAWIKIDDLLDAMNEYEKASTQQMKKEYGKVNEYRKLFIRERL